MSLNPHLGLLCVLILTACSSTPDGPDTQPAGFVVGDEPDAVRAAASVLAEPGSAADAATAMYFALAVTYPIAAGLGGGGLCTVYDPSSGRSEAFSFLPRAPAAGGAFAMPGNVAGFAALQGAFGKLPWQRDIARAEQLATTGFAISPALAARLATAQDLVRLDASLASEFLDESGHPKPAGSHVANRELGETLALIRTNGSAGFYRGDITASIAAYVAAQGGAVPTGELAGYRPLRAQASESTFGSATAYLPSPQVAPGNFASALLANVRSLRTENPQFDMARGVGMATARTIDQLHVAALPQDLGSTGFAAVDGTGQAVACAVSMNGPFGSGHTAEGTGVTLARAPSRTEAGIATIFLSPIIATTSGTIALVGAGAGGPNGNASLAYAVMRLAAEQNVISSQSSTGAAPYDTFNMITCQNGRCAAIADPGGAGLGIAMGK